MRAQVNKDLLPMKGHYFLFNAGTAPIVPFLPVYARQLGFSSVVVGTIYTILPVTGMLAKPLFGAIADRFQCQKPIFLAFQILTAIAFLCIHFIPEVQQETTLQLNCDRRFAFLKYCADDGELKNCAVENVVNLNAGIMNCELSCPMDPDMWTTVCQDWRAPQHCSLDKSKNLQFVAEIPTNLTSHEIGDKCIYFRVYSGRFSDGSTVIPNCPQHNKTHLFRTNCTSSCDSAIVNDLIIDNSIDNSQVTGMYQFWLFFWMLVLSWIGMAVVVSVGDAICFEMLGEEPHRYGNQRLWGAVGWGIFSILAGVLIDEFSKGQMTKNYSIVFYLMLIMLTLDLIVSYRLKHTQTKLSQSILKDVGALFTSPRILTFTIWCITVGLCTGLQWNFLFWHLEDLATSSSNECNTEAWIKTLQGLVMGVQCFGGELPFFFLSGWIINKITHVHAMSLVLLGFGVRFLLYSLLSNPWWVLPIELLQGVTFGIFYSTMASYAAIVAPAGTEATIQGLVGAIFEGVGVSLGSLLGGYLMGTVKGPVTFRIYGIAAIVLFLLHVLIQILLDRKGYHGRVSGTSGSDATASTRYSAPNDAIHMLEEDQEYQQS